MTADRVPSDHGAVPTHRTTVGSVGSTSRPRVVLPAVVDATVGEVIRVSLEGDTYHAQVREALDGTPDLRGAFANARVARADSGTNHLREWFDDVGISVGDPLLVDVVTPGFKYGLRRPGERVVYRATDPPSSSLVDIARDLDR